ncbi:MAG: AbrB/MazE/SpoVT family DNA-binding domain-containing protein [Thermofilaceae archaeon]
MQSRHLSGRDIVGVPYEAYVYLNNQVLIPASLVRSLKLQEVYGVLVTLEYEGIEFTLKVKLLKTRRTDSRQFTIPREVREKYGILPGSRIKVKRIEAIA